MTEKKDKEKEDVQPKAVSKDAVPEGHKGKAGGKAGLLSKISTILTHQYGGLETDIPVNHEYWFLKRTYTKNEAAGLSNDDPAWEV